MKPRKEKEVGLLEALLGQVDDYTQQESFEEPAPYEPVAEGVPADIAQAQTAPQIDLTTGEGMPVAQAASPEQVSQAQPGQTSGIDQQVAGYFPEGSGGPQTASPLAHPAPAPAAQPAIADEQVAMALAGADVGQRRGALRELLQRELTPPLVAAAAVALQDPEQDLRSLALQVIERAPQMAPLGPVEAATLDWDPGIRARAMALLGRTQNLSVIETLYERLSSESDEAVVGAGLTGLAHLLQGVQQPIAGHTVDRVVAIVASLAPTLKARFRRELGMIARVLPENELLARLRSGNVEIRLGAATLALESGSQTAYEVLAKGVSDSDAKIRNLATGALGRMQAGAYQDPQIQAEPQVETLAPLSSDPVAESPQSYTESVHTAEVEGPVEDVVFGALLSALDDPQPEVRSHSEEALRAMEPARLNSWLRDGLKSQEPGKAARAANIAVRLGQEQLARDLCDVLLRLPEGEDRRAVAAALRRFSKTWDVIAEMQAAPDVESRLEALRIVTLVDPMHTEPLLGGLADPNANVRLAAIEACGNAVEGEVSKALMNLMTSDSSGKTRVASVYAFTESIPALRLQAASMALQSDDQNVRLAAVGLLTGGTEEDVSLLARALHDRNTDVAGQAVAYLGAMPAPEALAVLWSSLRGVARPVQDLILNVLRDFDRGAVTLLGRQALESANSQDRVLGLRVLSRIDERSGDRMLAALDDPSSEVRCEALANLLESPDPTAVDAVGQRLRDPETKVRSMALKVLQAIEDDRVLPFLLDGARDPSKEVRDAAREALLSHSSGSVVELLLKALKFPTHRRAAADLLVELGDIATDRLLMSLTDATPEMRRAIGEILVASEATGRLMNDLSDRSPDKRLRAVEGIGAMGAIEAVDSLIGRLDDPDASVRQRTATILGELGDPRAIEPLKRAFIADPDMDVVAAIEPALRRLTGPPREDEDSNE